MNSGPNPKNLRVSAQSESKAFLKSADNNITDNMFSSAYSKMALIKRLNSPTHIPATYPVWSLFIILDSTIFILVASALDEILASTLVKEIGLQFFMSLLSFSST